MKSLLILHPNNYLIEYDDTHNLKNWFFNFSWHCNRAHFPKSVKVLLIFPKRKVEALSPKIVFWPCCNSFQFSLFSFFISGILYYMTFVSTKLKIWNILFWVELLMFRKLLDCCPWHKKIKVPYSIDVKSKVQPKAVKWNLKSGPKQWWKSKVQPTAVKGKRWMVKYHDQSATDVFGGKLLSKC